MLVKNSVQLKLLLVERATNEDIQSVCQSAKSVKIVANDGEDTEDSIDSEPTYD